VVLAALRANRPAQAALAVALIAIGAFGWWTVSPLFLTRTLNEDLPARSTATGAPTTSAAASPAATVAPAGPKVLATGQLQRVDDLHRGTGPVSLVELDGKTFLRFESVAIQNGPDLHVYLGRGMGGAYDGSRDLYLGALKATNGSFNYELPAGASLGDYKSVVVWCRAFTVLFTWADLR
jgi:electron transfer DM13